MADNDKASSSFQTFVLCAVSSGLGTLCLAPLFGYGADGSWAYAVLLSALFASLMTAVHSRTMHGRQADSLRAILRLILPGYVTAALLLASGLFFIAEAGVCACSAERAISTYLLKETPTGAILLALAFTAALIAEPGLRFLSRCCEMLILLLALPLVLLLVLCLANIDLREALVSFQPDIRGVIRLMPAALLSCGGGAAAAVFVTGRTGGNAAASSAGYLSSAVISVLLYSCAAGVFTTDGTARLEFPFIEAARSVSIGSISLTERFDTVFITIMLTAVILQLALFIRCAASCFDNTFGLRGGTTFLVLPAVMAAAGFAGYGNVLEILLNVSLRGLIALTAAIPIVLAVVSWIFPKGASDA